MPIEHNEENRIPQLTAFRPFDEMVSNLFNSANFNSNAVGVMHAAIGISGEATELFFHEDGANFIEEAGDLEFYLQSLVQQVGLQDQALLIIETRALYMLPAFKEECFHDILKAASDILDFAKKLWVYNKPLDTVMKDLIASCVGIIQGSLLRLYDYEGTTREAVINYNQTKLAKRYPGGVYTDQHAQLRLDKQGE
jgi:hypothetical protein